jgi:hypothetical protein
VSRPLSLYSLPTSLASFSRLRSLCDWLRKRLSTVFSAAGALCGMVGTALLAAQPDQTTAVFALYSGSAAAWMGVGYLTRQRWLLASNVIYLVLALKGLLL